MNAAIDSFNQKFLPSIIPNNKIIIPGGIQSNAGLHRIDRDSSSQLIPSGMTPLNAALTNKN